MTKSKQQMEEDQHPGGQSAGNHQRHPHPTHQQTQQQQPTQNQAAQHQPPGTNVAIRAQNLQQAAASGYIFPQQMPYIIQSAGPPGQMIRYPAAYPAALYNLQYQQGQQYVTPQQQQHLYAQAQQQINAYNAAACASAVKPPVPKTKRLLTIFDPYTGKAVTPLAGSEHAPSGSPQPTAEPVKLPEDINAHGGGQGGHDDQNAYDGVPPAFGQNQPAMIHDKPQSVAPVAPPTDGQGKNKAKSDVFQRITAVPDEPSTATGRSSTPGIRSTMARLLDNQGKNKDKSNFFQRITVAADEPSTATGKSSTPGTRSPMAPPADGQGKNKAKADFFQRITVIADEPSTAPGKSSTPGTRSPMPPPADGQGKNKAKADFFQRITVAADEPSTAPGKSSTPGTRSPMAPPADGQGKNKAKADFFQRITVAADEPSTATGKSSTPGTASPMAPPADGQGKNKAKADFFQRLTVADDEPSTATVLPDRQEGNRSVTIQRGPDTLHEAEDRWKRGINIYDTIKEEQILIEEMKKSAQRILNKLAKNLANLDRLLEKFLMLEEEVKKPENRSDADTERAEAEEVTAGRIGAVISVVFEQVMNDPSFSAIYAKIVHRVHSKAPVANSKIFRKKITDQCRKEFQEKSSIEEEVEILQEKLETEVQYNQKLAIKLEIEEKRFLAKWRSTANVRFIGELFKLQMLTPKIMIECVNMLISSGDEESVECLCKLLTTVGQRLEENIAQVIETMKIKRTPPSKWMPDPNFMNNTFTKLRALSDDRTYSSRIRFALLEVVELRAGSWVPRRDLTAPKTKEEVRRAIIREEQEEKKQLMSLPPASSPRGPIGGPPLPKKTDEWMSVSAKKSSRFSAAAKKTGPDSSGDLPKLAPGGGPWGMQSARGGGSGYPPRSSLPPRFSAGRESSDGPLPPPSRDAIVQALPETKSPSSHSSRESSRPQTPTKDSNSGSPRVPPPLTMTTRKTPPPTPQQPPEQIKDFDRKDAVKQIFEEFRSVKKVDFDWIEKRFPGDRRLDFVNELCTRVCDMSKEDDEKTAGGLIKCLIKADKITKAQVTQSLKDRDKDGILLLLPDVEIDAPLATSYLATCLTEVFMDEEDLGWLIRLGEGIEEDLGDTWTNLVSKVLEKLKHRFSEAVVQGLYKKTQGADRLPTEDLSMASISPEPIEKYIERTPEKIPEVVSAQSGEPSPISNESETEPSVPVPEVPFVKTEEIRPPPTNSELKTEDEISKVEKELEELNLKITAKMKLSAQCAQIERFFTNGGNEIDDGMGYEDMEDDECYDEGDMESDESGEPEPVKKRIVYDRDTLINYKTSACKLDKRILDSIPPELIRDGNSSYNIRRPPRSRMRAMGGPGWEPMRGPFQIPPQPPGGNRPPVTIQTKPIILHRAKDA